MTDKPVIVHVRWRARLFCSPFMVFIGGGWVYAVVASVHAGTWSWATGPGHGWFYELFGWSLFTVLGLPCLLALVLLWRARAWIYPDRMRARAVVAVRTLHLADVDVLQVEGGKPWSATAGPTFDRLDIRGRTRGGRRTGFSINSAFMTSSLAAPAFLPWVQARPELIRDEATRALFTGLPGAPAQPAGAT